jgi:SGNH domain-containing protein
MRVLRRILTVPILVSVCLVGVYSASDASTKPLVLQPVEPAVAASVTSSKPPTTWTPPLKDFGTISAGEGTVSACDVDGHSSQLRNPVPCIEGDVSATKTIVLVGDSNVGNWAPGLSRGLSKAHYKLDVFSFAGCPTSDITYVSADYIGATPAQCNEWHNSIIQAIVKLSPVAILTASSGIGPQYNQKAWDDGYETFFSKASGNRSSVRRIVIGTSPYFNIPPPTCLSRSPSDPLRCIISTKTTTLVGAYATYAKRDAAVAAASDATLIRTSSLFCFDYKCAAEVGGVVTFVDNDHVSTAYSDEISSPLTNAVLTALKS